MFSFLKKALIPDAEEKVSIATTDANPATTITVVPDLKINNDSISRTESSTSNSDSTANDTFSVDNHSEAPERTTPKGIVSVEDGSKSVNVLGAVMSSVEDLPRGDHNQPKIASVMPDKSVVVSKIDSGNSYEIASKSDVDSKVGAESLPSSSLGTTHIAPTAASKEVSAPLLKPSDAGASKTESTLSKVETVAASSSIDTHAKQQCNQATVSSLEKNTEKKLVKENEGEHEKDGGDSKTITHIQTVTNPENNHSTAGKGKIENETKSKTKTDAEFAISEVDISRGSDSAVPVPVSVPILKGIHTSTSIDTEGMRALSLSDSDNKNNNNSDSNTIMESVPQSQKISSSLPRTASVTPSVSDTTASTTAQTTAESVMIKTENIVIPEATEEASKVEKDILKNVSDTTEPCVVAKDFVSNVVKLGLGKAVTDSVAKSPSAEYSAKTEIQSVPMTDVLKNVTAVDNVSKGNDSIEKLKEKVVIDLTADNDDNVPKAAATGAETVVETGAGKGAPGTTRPYPHVVDLTGDSPNENGTKGPNGALTGQGTDRKWAPGLEVWETCLNELVELEAMAVAGQLDHEGSDTEEGESEAYGGGSDDMTEDMDPVYGVGYEDEGKDEEYSGYSLSDEEDNDVIEERNRAVGGVNGRADEDVDDEVSEVYIADDDEMVSYEDIAEEFEAQDSEFGPKFSGFASEQKPASRDVSPLPIITGGASDKLPIDAYREVILERIKVTTTISLEYGVFCHTKCVLLRFLDLRVLIHS
jgi:hypothetical protein